MATKRWIGNAAPVAQVTTLTPANVEVGDIFTVTVNGKSVSYTVSAATVADVCNGLSTALAASTYAEFREFSAVNVVTYIQLTGNTPGLPFTVSTSTTDGGGNNTQTLTASTTTACTGPNFFDNAQNWSTGSVPATDDDVYFDSGNVSCLYNLAQSSISLTSLNVYQSYTGTIGLPVYNSRGYFEYRAAELAISATTLNIGQGTGNGSGRIKLNVGSVTCTMNVYNTGQALEQGIPSVIWRGTSSSNVVNLNKGSVGLAFFPGNTAAVLTLRTGSVNQPTSDVNLVCGSGCTITTVDKNGGTVTLYAGATTITNYVGNLTIWAGEVATLNVDGGTVVYNSTGTLGSGIVSAGTLDFSQDQQAKTVTNPIQVYGTGALLDPYKVVGSLSVVLEQMGNLANLNLGQNMTLARS